MEDKSQFAGFWKRVAAYLLDSLIVGVCTSTVIGIVAAILLVGLKIGKEGMGGWIVLLYVFIFAVQVLYHSLFESSSRQATPGKMALGIVVTDGNGGRISFWRAVARNCARYISSLFLGLGYVICGFTARRQAVHDLLANTLVVKGDAPLRIGAKDSFQIMQSP